MAKVIALLRGINVGGHTVKMHELRRLFVALGFDAVETVIASGNVVFETDRPVGRELERCIEEHLKAELGYPVPTFVRTLPELKTVLKRNPYTLSGQSADEVIYTIFTRDAVPVATRRALEALATPNDAATVGRRVVYWHRIDRCKDSEIFGQRLEKLLGTETTSRNRKTIENIVARFAS